MLHALRFEIGGRHLRCLAANKRLNILWWVKEVKRNKCDRLTLLCCSMNPPGNPPNPVKL